uniref:Transcription factor AP-1 n=1 Tax=Neoseiulus barkeri TaxID=573039 RepID=A0A6M3YIL8_9ACAR|nr:transcription factor AP-1 [Neoseiulus barkeri]
MAADNNHQQQDIRSMKRSMTLDLEPQGSRAKRMRSQFSNSPTTNPVLTSPDLNRFALASPEVEQFIKDNIQATSSSTQQTPINVYLCPVKEITDRQAQFARGFEEALAKVQQKEQRSAKSEPTVVTLSSALSSSATGTTSVAASTAVAAGATTTVSSTASATIPTTVPTSIGAGAGTGTGPTLPASTTLTTLTSLTTANLQHLNVQMGTVPSSCDLNGSSDGIGSDTSDSMTLRDEQTSLTAGSLGRINMMDQDKMKLERKRQRNRIAASKCRKKKIERITQLEDQVNRLKTDNQEYEKMISLLRNEVTSLRQEASIHRQHGCLIEL